MKRGICLVITLFSLHSLFAQYESIQEDVEKGKPEKYQNRTLKSEKTGDKKFGIKRRFIQNTVTHYNYYFNANNKLRAVVERARAANKENYLDLLPFYDYTLKNTSLQKVELDSVIYRATAGILLHDLRNNWVDDLYLIIGEAYFFKNDMDSASMTFQFINYNLMPKAKDEDIGNVGSSNDKSTDISIANKEGKGWGKKPIRNDALIWQIRTLIEQGQYPEAAGLVTTLQNDVNFPKRLKDDLEEVNAYWFYQQKMYDSAAIHLENALGTAENKQGKARMQFLLAQLYEISRQPDKAKIYYAKAAKNTNDPLMDIYANLNSAKMYKGNAGKDLDNNINQLIHMAKKDKYESFKDVVYYSAGELALRKPDTIQAIGLYKKSVSYNTSNAAVKNKAFLELGNIAYYRKDYKNAASYYDSLQLSDPVFMNDAKLIQERKDALVQIVSKIDIIEREDSLQRIAAMSASDREKFVRGILKKIRNELGLKEEGEGAVGRGSGNLGQITSADLFGDQNSSGEWYFYSSNIKARGYNDFKTKWGKRNNVDNWRRAGATQGISNNPDDITDTQTGKNTKSNPNPQPDETTYDGLMSHVPLTTDQKNLSNSNLSVATYELGNLYLNLEEYGLATQMYESSLKRYPDSLYNGQLYMNAMYAYQKLGDLSKSNYYKNLLISKFKNNKYADAILNPTKPKNEKDVAATKGYEQVYNLFIEGNFEQALKEKKVADALYGNTYWTPQLLYIEAVYYVRQKQDSQAIVILTNIANLYPTSPLRPKALTLADVLRRRSDIENYLTNLQVTRKTDSVTVTTNKPINNNPTPTDNKNKGNEVKKDNKEQGGVPNVNDAAPAFSFDVNLPVLVVMVLDKVDPVYITEVKNAFNRYNRSKYSAKNITIADDALDKDRSLLLFTPFANADDAITYIQSLKSEASSQITWLPANKYSYILISESSLNLLKTNKNLKAYTDLLHSKYPEKF